MVKDTFFSTPVYYAGLADAETLNEHLKKDIRAWQKQDPEGTVRSNVAQAGAWHSATDMHTRGEFNGLTREIFELVQGTYDELGYDPDFEPVCDSMWANINPRHAYNRHHTHPHALWSGVYYVQAPDDCGLLYFTIRGHKRRYSRLISIRADGIPTPGTRCFFNLWRVV